MWWFGQIHAPWRLVHARGGDFHGGERLVHGRGAGCPRPGWRLSTGIISNGRAVCAVRFVPCGLCRAAWRPCQRTVGRECDVAGPCFPPNSRATVLRRGIRGSRGSSRPSSRSFGRSVAVTQRWFLAQGPRGGKCQWNDPEGRRRRARATRPRFVSWARSARVPVVLGSVDQAWLSIAG